MNLIPALAALAVVLAGCAASPSSSLDQTEVDPEGVPPGATSSPTGGAGAANDPGGAPPPAVETATLVGRVHDPSNLSIIGARIDILGTETRGVSGANGTFSFAGLAPGKITIRIESGGFVTREVPTALKRGEVTELDLELRADPAFAPGLTAHVHDYWGGATKRVLMDVVVPVHEDMTGGYAAATPGGQGVSMAGAGAANPSAASVARTNQGERWEFFLPPSPDSLPSTVWPGTGEVRFTVDWTTEPENRMPKVGFEVQDAVAKAFVPLGSTVKGGTIVYPINASNQTDNGHALFSAWKWRIYIDNDVRKAPNWEPVIAFDGIKVKIEIVKGAIALDPAHRDWWMGADTVKVGDPTRDYRPNMGVSPIDSQRVDGGAVISILGGDVPVVPPGTEKLVVRFTWRLDQPLPFNYGLRYRTADMNPRDTEFADFKVPKLIDSGAGFRVYEIPVSNSQADPFYTARSQWGFKWIEETASPTQPPSPPPYYFGGFFLHLGFDITAYKHPDF